MTDTVKRCSKCGLTKPTSEFYRRRDSKDGFEGRCKLCANSDKKTPVEQRREITRRYYHSHKDICKKRKDKWVEKNRENYLESQRRWHREHPSKHTAEQSRKAQLRQYGITPDDFENMKKAQDNKCAICHEESDLQLNVDHDHMTGSVRSLLCRKCNTALGLISDSPIIAREMVHYLVSHSARGIHWELLGVYD